MHPNSPIFEFLNHLIQRANITRIICVGDNVAKSLVGIKPHVEIIQFGAHTGSPKWLRLKADEEPVEQVHFIETDLEQPFFIDQALLEDAIVVCFDVLDRLQNPNPLIATLATVRQHCKFMLITVADRVRTAGFTFSESSGKTRSHLKWSAEEFFQALVRAGFPQSMLFGFASHSEGVEPKNSILVVAGVEAEPTVLPDDLRVAAIINVFNEVDIIETTVRYLADQGIDVHVVDNWSDDGSFELCQRLLEQKLVTNLLRFPAQKTDDYEWAKQLEHTAEYAAQLNVDWVIHYDADEIRCSPWPNVNLADSIRFVDALGYTAIDFTVLDFRFTNEDDVGGFSPSEFHFFEFGRHSSYFTQIKAWKNGHQLVELAESGGHEAVFAEQRVYPFKFLIKHYSLRSKKQATKKIFRERFPRIAKERAERGWHVHFDQYRYLQSIEPWKPSELTFYDETTFPYEFLVERLSGVGVCRESHLGLNEKTAGQLGRVIGEMDGRLTQAVAERDGQIASLHQAVAERDGQIASLHQTVPEGVRQIASLHQAVVERDGLIGRLNQAVAERDGRIGRLNQVVAERDRQIGRLNQVVAEPDRQIGRLNQAVNDILNSTSWRLTRPVRSIGTQWKRVWRIMKLALSAIQYGRGIKLTACKAFRVYQNEGAVGVRRVFRRLRTFMPTRPTDSVQPLREVSGSKLVNYRTDFNQTRTEFVEYRKNPPINPLVKLIAFYLPQFHPFPENDRWWGKGFTEWTNVGKALPNYVGHYQPHCPIHLGYYDLRVPEVMEEQARLAKEYGIYGFSYYFYWFDGKILMGTPLESMLANKKIDIPFCVTWANENWSRRWDGLENDLLMAQNHSDEDSLAFIRHLVKYFKDERYIRIDGKPILIVYRANIIPNVAATAKIWREEALKHGFPGLYLVSAQTFGIHSPKEFAFDASVEFPPHNFPGAEINHEVEVVNPEFNGYIYSYDQWVANAVLRLSKEPDYKLYRTAMLSWDNTARKQSHSHIFHGFSLSLYKKWLSSIVNRVHSSPKYTADEKIVFVNAWNEWAEGTHLEPDQKFGYGYLQTTYDVLRDSNDLTHKIIVVTHDAFPSGAQYLALNMARELAQGFGFKVEIVCLGGGVLKDQYAQYGRLHDLTGLEHRGPAAHALAKNLAAAGHRFAIVNTTVSGFFLETLKAHGIQCISLVHELRGVLDQYNLSEQAKTIATLADKVVFATQQVADQFEEIAPVNDVQRVLRPQGLYKKNARVRRRDAARQELRKAVHLPPDALIVLGVGYADHRKGVDLFVDIGKILVGRLPNVYLVWLGLWPGEMQARVGQSLAENPQMNLHFIFLGHRDDTDLFYAGADVYALTSREDPFPSVVLEAMDASLPVVAFEGVGGCTELLSVGCGKLVPAFEANAFSAALEEILEGHDLANRMGQTGKTQIRERFSFRNYLFDLLKLLEYPLPRVSVVVPNYNYARFLSDRIRTIESQKFPVYELIILDDCSSDDSAQVIEDIIQGSALDIKFIRNSTNSGSVFAQWHKGVELATGDLVWIAEADDLSAPNFLTEVLRGFNNPDVVLSYCESKQIALDGKVLCDNYLDYVADIGRERWLKPYVCDGQNEIVDALSVKNTIPNVSAAVFRRDILSEVLKREQDQIHGFTVAGDWYIYTKLLEHGGIAFSPRSANLHRRHAKSVTNASLNLSQFTEIVRMQRMVATSYLVSDSRLETARCYAQKLYEQFGLASREFPNFEQVFVSGGDVK